MPRDQKVPLDSKVRGERAEYRVPRVTRVLLEWTACLVLLVKRARRSVLLYLWQLYSRLTVKKLVFGDYFRDQDVDYRGKVPENFEDWFAERNIRDDAPCEINSHTKKHWLPVAVRFVFFLLIWRNCYYFKALKILKFIYIGWYVIMCIFYSCSTTLEFTV